MKVWAWAAAKATKSYKHTYGTLADSQHSDDDLRPYHPTGTPTSVYERSEAPASPVPARPAQPLRRLLRVCVLYASRCYAGAATSAPPSCCRAA